MGRWNRDVRNEKDVQFRDETGEVFWRSLGEVNGVFPDGTFAKRRRRAIFADDLRGAEEATDEVPGVARH